MEYTDREILELIRVGNDDKALSFIYKKTFPKIKNLILKNGGRDDEAKDIFQDAVISFYNYVKQGKFDAGNAIDAFIYSVSRNLWINYVKKQNRVTELNTEYDQVAEVGGDSLSYLISNERTTLVTELLDMIGERCKELLLNSIYHKLSMREICEKMGFSTENAAKTSNYKCKQKLVEIVKNSPSLADILK